VEEWLDFHSESDDFWPTQCVWPSLPLKSAPFPERVNQQLGWLAN